MHVSAHVTHSLFATLASFVPLGMYFVKQAAIPQAGFVIAVIDVALSRAPDAQIYLSKRNTMTLLY